MLYRSGHLESSRTAVLEDLGAVYVIPVGLLRSLLPQVHQSQAQLEAAKTACTDKRGRWNEWPNKPCNMTEHEDHVFTALPLLFTSIRKSFDTLPPAYKPLNNPSKAPDSERSNSSKPDGYLLRDPPIFAGEKAELGAQSEGDFWEDIAVPFEFKKGSRADDRTDNERKIIWSMHHMLRNDPCRRFTFGITVENTNMRVWLCHRSATYASEPFDFMGDKDLLIHVVTAMSFADSSSLGWDPSLRRRRDGNRMVYDIDVSTGENGEVETFTSTKIISDFGAEAMRGRATRVFKATRQCETVVVKTCWQDEDRRMEGDVLDEVLSAMREHPDIDYEADKKLFLSVVCHGCVKIDGRVDHILDLIMRGTDLPEDFTTFRVPLPNQVPQEKTNKLHRGGVGDVPHIGIKAHTNLTMGNQRTTTSKVGHRKQYRIVFYELGEPLHNLFNLKAMFRALADATRALKIMFQCGFVHRDVSSGNILYFEGHGMLADLEYAKRPSDDLQHDVRTGTLYFISVEVLIQHYCFLGTEYKKGIKMPTFKHNILHDLESLWWVAVWTLFTRSIEDSSSKYDPDAQLDTCSTFFPTVISGTSERSLILASPLIFGVYTERLPEEFEGAADYVRLAQTRIIHRYKHAEKGQHIDASAFDGAHDEIYELLEQATEASPENVIQLETKLASQERPAKRMKM